MLQLLFWTCLYVIYFYAVLFILSLLTLSQLVFFINTCYYFCHHSVLCATNKWVTLETACQLTPAMTHKEELVTIIRSTETEDSIEEQSRTALQSILTSELIKRVIICL